MKTYNIWAKLLLRQQLNQIHTQQKLILITKKKLLTQERKHKQSFVALILIRL